jgi:integrase
MANYQLKAGAYHLQLKEIKKLFLNTNSFRDWCLLKSVFWAGLRREEATKLDVRDIDFDKKRIKVRGKGDKPHTVPIIDYELFNELKYLINGRTEGFIFAKSDGKPLTVSMINHFTAKAGIKNPNPRLKHINPHIFRHSITRYLKNKAFSVEWIHNFLGHAFYRTTMDMYGTLSIDEMQQEAEKKL